MNFTCTYVSTDKSEQGLAAADLDGENTQEPHQEEVEEGKNHKKHKHKHKHKHHKKSKKERQIYMPPALKHAGMFLDMALAFLV